MRYSGLHLLALAICCFALGCQEESSVNPVEGNNYHCDPACTEDQTCTANGCVDNTPGGGGNTCDPACGPNQTCTSNGCVDNTPGGGGNTCDPACVGDRECVAGNCVFSCAVHCGDSCCTNNQRCDSVTGACSDACANGASRCNGECCTQEQICKITGCGERVCDPACTGDQVCVQGTCKFPCTIHCGDRCCNDDQRCDSVTGACSDACVNGSSRCNGECCTQNQTCSATGCVENQPCVPACTGDQVCVNGNCVFPCAVHCGDRCCGDEQRCDAVT